jgi:cytochrome c biogenesis protein CcmG/thiol:disulfide interchange protein DsbE
MKNYVIILIAIIAMAAKTNAEINVKPGKVYEIVEVKSIKADYITDFVFLDEEGNKCLLSDYTKGKSLFLNFWGTWCGPCRAEIPAIIKLQSEYANQLNMVGIALEKDYNNSKQNVIDFAKQQGINYINFVAPKTIIDKITASYGGIRAVPTTFISNKEGKIVERIIGLRNKSEFQAAIDKIIN